MAAAAARAGTCAGRGGAKIADGYAVFLFLNTNQVHLCTVLNASGGGQGFVGRLLICAENLYCFDFWLLKIMVAFEQARIWSWV